ncbi:hypothetical protein K7X08_011753 [Anisodus acutangulus]|uniref:Uncharacterized protein n=1 Tax=Anisodus acutangulus TaxID=402998 RepID=A0A9Q1MQM7_9SOLA|nr:hypothetical protein K7X08_011753 [Anisodus acutangulus]
MPSQEIVQINVDATRQKKEDKGNNDAAAVITSNQENMEVQIRGSELESIMQDNINPKLEGQNNLLSGGDILTKARDVDFEDAPFQEEGGSLDEYAHFETKSEEEVEETQLNSEPPLSDNDITNLKGFQLVLDKPVVPRYQNVPNRMSFPIETGNGQTSTKNSTSKDLELLVSND